MQFIGQHSQQGYGAVCNELSDCLSVVVLIALVLCSISDVAVCAIVEWIGSNIRFPAASLAPYTGRVSFVRRAAHAINPIVCNKKPNHRRSEIRIQDAKH
jgi:hypothetical protein